MPSLPKHSENVGQTKPVDVVFVIESLEGGGAQRVASILANEWSRRGHKVCILTMQPEEMDFYDLEPGVVRRSVGLSARQGGIVGRAVSNVRDLLALRRRLKEVGAPTAVSFVHSMNVLTLIASTALPMSVIVSERSDPGRQTAAFPWILLRRLLYRFAKTVTANSNGMLKSMAAYVPARKLAYVPNPVLDVPGDCSNKAASPVSEFVLSVGRLHEVKGHDCTIAAYAMFCGDQPNWRLRIVGDGPMASKLREQAQALSVSDRIDWFGLVRDPLPHYRSADIFVLASRHEGLPNALLEAMSCGLPVIVTDASPGPLEFVTHNVTGLVVPVDDADALRDAITTLAQDPALRREMGERGRQRVASLKVDRVLPIWEGIVGLPNL